MLARRTSRVATAFAALAGLAIAGRPAAAQTHTSPVQVTSDGGHVWVANPDSDSVGKLATASNTLVGEYPVGDHPRTVALDNGGGYVYVANQGSQDLTPKPQPETVMRLSQASGAVVATHALPFGCAPYGVLFNPTNSDVYVTCERRGTVMVLDASLTTFKATVPLAWSDPRSMALTADGSRLYVAHFLTREPGSTAHVTEIDTTVVPPAVVRVLDIPADVTTCETINSGKGVMNLLLGMHLTPPGAVGVGNQLWVGGVLQNNLSKGMFRNDPRFGGHADPLLCQGGTNTGKPCSSDDDCSGGACVASLTAVSRNLYKVSFHDVTRFAIMKIDLASGAVVGKVDVDEANQGTDLVFSNDGSVAYAVDQFFNSLHIFNTLRGQGGDPTTIFAGPSRFGLGGVDPASPCNGGSFLTASEVPFILPPQVQLVPIAADPIMVGGGLALTGNEYDVTTGQMRAVPDSVGTTPHGIALHPDGTRAYVANFLSRNVTVVKTDGFFCPGSGAPCQSRVDCNGCAPRVHAVIPSINTPDPLPPQLLDGKILFHTAARDASVPNGIGLGAAAPRFNLDDPNVLEPVGAVVSTSHDASYVACISCHPEGGLDGRSWDFSQFGASLRNTMDLRGRAGFAPGVCTDPPGLSCTTDSQCANNGVGTCTNDPSVLCELDIQCGQCAGDSPTPGVTCMADRQCGGVCSNNNSITCLTDGDCGGVCREDGVTPCTDDDDCDFGCQITNQCNFFSCDTQPCDVAKCIPASLANVPRNITSPGRFLSPMMTVHWNGDRDQVEDFEFTYRSLMGAGDCDGVEDLPDKCIGALVMRSNVAKPQEPSPDLADSNRGLSPRLDHMADYVYSLTSFVSNPNLDGGPSPDAAEGAKIFFAAATRCAECHNGPSPTNQHFSDKRPDASYPLGQQGRPDTPNPFLRHNVATFNAFDLTDPLAVASDIGQFQNSVLPIPASRGALLDYVTPTLVDVWNSAPFNHDGTFATLLHGITPCDDTLDDCAQRNAGKNVRDQHGTTTNLTPRQLRQLEQFLLAPHNAVSGPVGFAAPLRRLVSATVRFGPGADDDRLTLKARFRLPVSSSFDVSQGALAEPVTLSLADVDEAFFERTIPAGRMDASGGGSSFTFKDKTVAEVPGIRKVRIRLREPATREYEIAVSGKRLELGLLDKNHVMVALEVGDDAFVKTRTFAQSNAARSAIRIKER